MSSRIKNNPGVAAHRATAKAEKAASAAHLDGQAKDAAAYDAKLALGIPTLHASFAADRRWKDQRAITDLLLNDAMQAIGVAIGPAKAVMVGSVGDALKRIDEAINTVRVAQRLFAKGTPGSLVKALRAMIDAAEKLGVHVETRSVELHAAIDRLATDGPSAAREARNLLTRTQRSFAKEPVLKQAREDAEAKLVAHRDAVAGLKAHGAQEKQAALAADARAREAFGQARVITAQVRLEEAQTLLASLAERPNPTRNQRAHIQGMERRVASLAVALQAAQDAVGKN